ncbi:precorrin-2 dehydrogenase/sirohydrochlorin ferrochelatase family protein [Paenibacillus silvae]|uniref:precorrin-2 dehydrogenase/sirohydrochlorin ferrochelatase family protein n=1 Tax=Paenibacillus silvae TaxID=1325358 RepID=UPI0011A2CC38|nr:MULTISPECIES: bifunctional precorrin-2 dehydrogenase/sirohydrochlorin ferrochelatase [Paenibacillus]MCK6076092.1 bifunctional precorrin-2 dehydrogenase/sirohydrochlorin ferrochelatase [Paenibacillus silvae]MCK6150749.1 bifunctional precorrin-2 dehydrogenase/sirohydrochlorin ferrochelatase [Paenibacillus silvae]MCK6269009.1 bifunctional precorrin-2 dehydrogenase/sirohydrochlorin ferrochelatase [Paenibacillus silvae]
MKHYTPIYVNTSGKPVLVIGGGRVAERKVKGLLQSEARITVISPQLTPELKQLHQESRFEWIARSYRNGDLRGAFLVYAATDDSQVNTAVVEEAEAASILVNDAISSGNSSFITPSVVRRGRLSIAISTAGAGPAAATEIRALLEQQFGDEYETYLDFLHQMRMEIKSRALPPVIRSKLLRRLTEMDILDQIRTGQFQWWTAEEIGDWISRNQEEM